MPPGVQIIKRVEHQVKALEEFNVEPRIFDICVVGFQLHVRIEFLGTLLCDLKPTFSDRSAGYISRSYQCLGLLYMFTTKEKLPIQIAEINCV